MEVRNKIFILLLIFLYLALDDSSIGIQTISLRNFLLEMLARTIAEEKRSQTKYKFLKE